jgi:hypothetical protein
MNLEGIVNLSGGPVSLPVASASAASPDGLKHQ